jgi:hypothetical protein
MNGLKVLAAFYLLLFLLLGMTTLITFFITVDANDTKVELDDGRTVHCVQAKGFTKSISCDWANAKEETK